MTAVKGSWIQMDFGSSQIMGVYGIATDNPPYAPKSWTLCGSNDPNATTWYELDKRNDITWSAGERKDYRPLNGLFANTSYRYYRFIVQKNGGNNGYITPSVFFAGNQNLENIGVPQNVTAPDGSMSGNATISLDLSNGHTPNWTMNNPKTKWTNFFSTSNNYPSGIYSGSIYTTVQGLNSIYSYTGLPQTYTVPSDVRYIDISAWGGGGGGGNSGIGGNGAACGGRLSVNSGEILTIIVAGGGYSTGGGGYSGGGTGGLNGAGAGGGGGCTIISRAGTNLVVVSGGGGGGYSSISNGGNGGLINGDDGRSAYVPSIAGFGATQSDGGISGYNSFAFLGSKGSSLNGGNGAGSLTIGSGGGGGGLYGGGGGSLVTLRGSLSTSGGGGGSSGISNLTGIYIPVSTVVGIGLGGSLNSNGGNGYVIISVPPLGPIINITVSLSTTQSSSIYGETPTFNLTYTPPLPVGFVPGNATFINAPTSTSNVGNYYLTINAVNGLSLSGYSFVSAVGTVPYTVNKATLTVNADNQTMYVGDTVPVLTETFTGFKNGNTISVVTGTLSGKTGATNSSSAGTYDIIPYIDDLLATNYNFIAGSKGTLTINKSIYVPVNGITASPITGLKVGDTTPITLIIQPTNATNKNVTYTSSDMTVATVDTNGNVFGVKAGSSTITIRSTENVGIFATVSVTVIAVPITGITVIITPGQSSTYGTAGIIGYTLNSNPTSAITGTPSFTITKTGLNITSENIPATLPVGTYNITYFSGLNANNCTFVAVVGTVPYTVNKATLTVNADNQTMYVGGTLPILTEKIDPTGLKNGDKSADVVSGPLLASTTANVSLAGNYDIVPVINTLSADNYSFLKGSNGTLTIKSINVLVASITASPASITDLKVGGTRQITLTILPTDAIDKTVSYTSSNSLIATVSDTGLVTGVAIGSTSITITANGTPTVSTNVPVTVVASNYSFTRAPETYIVPTGVYSINIKAWGGGGGGRNSSDNKTLTGGNAAMVTGNLTVTPGQVLAINVAGGGSAAGGGVGGYGNGGAGTSNGAGGGGGSGGGCTTIRDNTNYLVMVAGGGGAGGEYDAGGNGGNGSGDGISSGGGSNPNSGMGGTGAYYTGSGNTGSGGNYFGNYYYGGATNGAANGYYSGGGGSGWYGGGGGTSNNGSRGSAASGGGGISLVTNLTYFKGYNGLIGVPSSYGQPVGVGVGGGNASNGGDGYVMISLPIIITINSAQSSTSGTVGIIGYTLNSNPSGINGKPSFTISSLTGAVITTSENIPTTLAAGTYNITYSSGLNLLGYSFVSNTVSYTVDPAKVIVKVSITSGQSNTYGTARTIEYTLNSNPTSAITRTPSFTITNTSRTITSENIPATLPVGFYTITYSSGLSATGYTFVAADGQISYEVKPAVLTVNIEGTYQVEYGKDIPPLGQSVTGFVNDDKSDVVKGKPLGVTTATKGSDVGEYTVSPSIVGLTADNYKFEAGKSTATLTILQAYAFVTITPQTTVYGTLPDISYTIQTGSGTVVRPTPIEGTAFYDITNDATGTVIKPVKSFNNESVKGFKNPPDAGTYKVHYINDYINRLTTKNYDLSNGKDAVTFTVTKARVYAFISSVSTISSTYGENPVNVNVSYFTENSPTSTAIQIPLTKNPVINGIPPATSNVGSYRIYISTAPTSNNYEIIIPSPGTENYSYNYTITPKLLTISTITIQPKTYDGTTTAEFIGGSLVGLENGDDSPTPKVFLKAVFSSAYAGDNKSVIFSLDGPSAANYILTQPSVTGNIIKANQYLIINPGTSIYLSPIDISYFFSVDDQGTQEGIDKSLVEGIPNYTGPTSSSNVGKYNVTYKDGLKSENYNILPGRDGSYTITQRDANVIVAQKSFDYSTTPPPFELSGYYNLDGTTVQLNNSQLSGDLKYTITNTGTLVNIVSFTNTTDAGTYSVIYKNGLSNINFNFTGVIGYYYIQKIPCYVTVTSQTSTYGQTPLPIVSTYNTKEDGKGSIPSIPSTIINYTIVNRQTSVEITSFSASTSAGTYYVSYKSGLIHTNYTFSVGPFGVGYYTINQQKLNLTGITCADKTYDGNTNATVTGTLTGFVNSEPSTTATLIGNFPSPNIDNYNIIFSLSPSNGNYRIDPITGYRAQITAKSLTVSDTKVTTKPYDGTTNADLTGGSLVGVIGMEDVVLSTPTGTFEKADVGAGIKVTTNYTLDGTKKANYTLIKPSNLTGNIEKATLYLVVTTPKTTITYGSVPAIEYTINTKIDGSGKEISNITVSGPPNYTITGTKFEGTEFNKPPDAGTYNVIYRGGINNTNNYTLSAGDAATFTIQKATAYAFISRSDSNLKGTYGSNVQVNLILLSSDAKESGRITTGITYLDRPVINGLPDASSPVGEYTINITKAPTSNNYDIKIGTESNDCKYKITSRSLTIADPRVNDKTYDGTDRAVVRGRLQGFADGNTDYTVLLVGRFESKDAGTQKVIFGLSGDNSGNYELIDPEITGTIKQAPLTFEVSSNYTTQNPPSYTTGTLSDATITIESGKLTLPAKDYTVANLPYTFTDETIGNGNKFVLSNQNYAITEFKVKITKATAYAFIDGREDTGRRPTNYGDPYDVKIVFSSTDNPPGTGKFNGIPTLNPTANYLGFGTYTGTSPPAGTYQLYINNIESDDNYQIINRSSNTEQTRVAYTVNTVPLTIANDLAIRKVYDGTTTAQITGGELSGFVNGDDNLKVYLKAEFTSADAGDEKFVRITLDGPSAPNYTITVPADFKGIIDKAPLTVINTSIKDKTYDGKTDATINAPGELSGLIDGDKATLTESYSFASKDVSSSPIAIVANYTMNDIIFKKGSASNYTLTLPTLTANITAKTLTVENASIKDKTYDGKTDADIEKHGELSGLIDGEEATLNESYSFASKDVSSLPIAIVANYTINDIEFTKGEANNYTLTLPTLTANITAKTLTVENTTIKDKTYDGKTDATINHLGELSGLIDGEEATLNESYTFASKDVSSSPIAIVANYTMNDIEFTKGEANNYTLTLPNSLTAKITAKTLTVENTTIKDKTYDGTTDADIEKHGELSGLIDGEEATLNESYSFASKDVSSLSIAIVANYTINDIEFTKGEANNYTLTLPTLTANITAKTLTVDPPTFTPKTYNGGTDVTIDTEGSLNGLVNGDTKESVGFLQAYAFANANANQQAPITATVSITSKNYDLTVPTNFKGIINKAPLTITVTGSYSADTSTAPSYNTGDLSGTRYGDPVDSMPTITSGTLILPPNSSDKFVYTVANSPYTFTDTTIGTGNGFVLSDSNYAIANFNVTITNAEVTASIEADQSVAYGTPPVINVVYSITGINTNYNTSEINKFFTGAPNSDGSSDAKDYDVLIKPGVIISDNYQIKVATTTMKYTVKKVQLSTTSNPVINTKPYDGNTTATFAGGQLSGFVNGDDPAKVLLKAEFTSADAGEGKSVTFVLDGEAARNYSLPTIPPLLTGNIDRVTLTVKANDQSMVFGGRVPDFTQEITGFIPNEGISLVTGANTVFGISDPAITNKTLPTDPNSIGYHIKANIEGLNATNYIFTESTEDGKIIIGDKPLYVIITPEKSSEYGSDPNIEYTFVDGSGIPVVLSDITDLFGKAVFNTVLTKTSQADTYSLKYSTGLTSRDYVFLAATDAVEYRINKATLTVNADNKEMTYKTAVPTLTQTIDPTGFKNGDTISVVTITGTAIVTTTGTSSSDVGPYTITPSIGNLTATNYRFEAGTTGVLTINKATAYVIIDADQTSVYGTDPVINYTLKPNANGTGTTIEKSGILNFNDTATFTPALNSISPVGNYDLTYAGGLINTNYEFLAATNVVSYGVTNAPAYVIITPDQTSVYGSSTNIEYTCNTQQDGNGLLVNTTGTPTFITSDGVTFTNGQTSGSNAGNYNIKYQGGLTNNSYTIQAVNTTVQYQITKANAYVIIETGKSSVYGETPVINYILKPDANGDGTTIDKTEIGLSGTAVFDPPLTVTSNVAPYQLKYVSGLTSTNYDFKAAKDTVEYNINKATLTVNADDQTMIYKTDLPTLTQTIDPTGFKNGQTVTDTDLITGLPVYGSTDATNESPVESYMITPSIGDLTAINYTFVAGKNGVLTIENAPAYVIIAAGKSSTYGTDPIIEYMCNTSQDGSGTDVSVTESLIRYTTNLTKTSNAGTYPLKYVSGLSNLNYTIKATTNSVDYIIRQATLTVNADDKEMTYKTAVPVLTETIDPTGFKNGDTISVVNKLSTAIGTCAATNQSPVGSYTITPSIGDLTAINYTFVLGRNGLLTINKATAYVIITAGKSSTYGTDPIIEYMCKPNPDGSGADVSVTELLVNYTTNLTKTSNAGTYPLKYVSGLSNSNYNIYPTTNSVNYVIRQATLTVIADNQTMTYKTAVPVLTETIDSTGFKNEDTVSVVNNLSTAIGTCAATRDSDVNTYTITASVGQLNAINYTFVASTTNSVLTITKATAYVIITADQRSVYGTTPSINYTFNTNAAGNGTTITTSTTSTVVIITNAPTSISNVASYQLKYASGLTSINYELLPASSNVTYQVVAANAYVIITAGQSSFYGETPIINYTFNTNAAGNGTTITPSTTSTVVIITNAPNAGSVAGSYQLTYASGLTSTNYNILPASSAVAYQVVNRPAYVIIEAGQSSVYGDAIDIQYTCNTNADGSGTTLTPTGEAKFTNEPTSSSHAGNYLLTYASGLTNLGYTILGVSPPVSYQITQTNAYVVITPGQTSIYGTVPVIQYTIQDRNGTDIPINTIFGFRGTAQFNGAPTATSPPGVYTITYAGGLTSTDYIFGIMPAPRLTEIRYSRSVSFTVREVSFNWKAYLTKYPDLTNAGIRTRKQAWEHWITFGQKEGRTV